MDEVGELDFGEVGWWIGDVDDGLGQSRDRRSGEWGSEFSSLETRLESRIVFVWGGSDWCKKLFLMVCL